MAGEAKLEAKLLIDKTTNKVVYAETDEGFVDTLLSFLTLPLGKIALLLNPSPSPSPSPNPNLNLNLNPNPSSTSPLGCVDNLYHSVDRLDPRFFRTHACRSMLLSPLSSSSVAAAAPAEPAVEALRIDLDRDRRLGSFHVCPEGTCAAGDRRICSLVPHTPCSCGRVMSERHGYRPHRASDGGGGDADRGDGGVFVRGKGVRYIVTDDLRVMKSCASNCLALLQRIGIKNSGALQHKNVKIGRDEVLKLLRQSLISTTPLSDVFVHNWWGILNQQKASSNMQYFRAPTAAKSISSVTTTESQKIRITLLQNKSTNKVAYSEAGEDFLDLIFSFLVLPLGLVIKLLAGSTSVGCIDNLYHSIDELSDGYDCIKSEECKSALMSPKLLPHFSIEKGVLNVEEAPAHVVKILPCEVCCKKGLSDPQGKANNLCSNPSNCKEVVSLAVINPKTPVSTEEIVKPLARVECGGGYVKGPMRFLVTDNLGVAPFCSINGLDAVRDSKGNIDDLEVVKVNVGPGEALDLLKASLVSNRALTDAFLSGHSLAQGKKNSKS